MKNFNFFKFLAITAFVFSTAFFSFAETFYLSTGEKIEGTITDVSGDCVVITPDPIQISKSDVFKSRKERFNANKNWNRHFFEFTGGLGIYYRGFVGKFIYSFDIPTFGTMPLHSFSLSFGYKLGTGKKK